MVVEEHVEVPENTPTPEELVEQRDITFGNRNGNFSVYFSEY